MILQIQQRYKSERHNVFTKETNKTALSSNDDKRVPQKEFEQKEFDRNI